jgi:hypothetical protein
VIEARRSRAKYISPPLPWPLTSQPAIKQRVINTAQSSIRLPQKRLTILVLVNAANVLTSGLCILFVLMMTDSSYREDIKKSWNVRVIE